MSIDLQNFKNELVPYIDEDYREFVLTGIITDYPLLGVRIPKQREIGKTIVESGLSEEFLKREPETFEETTIRGFVVANLSYEEMIKNLDLFLKYVDNWETCDVFCSELRHTIRPFRDEFLECVVEKLIADPREFYARVGLVILLTSYVEFDYLFYIFETVESVAERKEHYVAMATAWLLQTCFAKFPEETFSYLEKSKLPKSTFNKAVSKICSSFRTSEEQKEKVRALRKTKFSI